MQSSDQLRNEKLGKKIMSECRPIFHSRVSAKTYKCDEEEPDEKPPSTKEMLEALQFLRRGIQQRGDFDVFEKHKSYEDIIMKLAEEAKIQSTLDSFNSMTCTSTLIRKLFDEKKFTSARTKTREVAVNVIAPFAVQLTIDDLKTVDFVSILVDASNHKAIKLVPVIVRYFSPTTGVRNKILEFSNLPGETADLIHNQIIKVLNSFNLTEKIISYSADNTNTNFGGLQRKGKNNVFIKLKETLNKEILGMCCYAHIIHNSIQCASDCLPIDIESIVCKIFGFFHIYTVRVENLKEFCDFADVQYKDLLSHSKTRWLSLFPAIERIISIYNGLKSYFLSQNTCPNALKIFFENESSLLWLKFLSSQLKTINSYIKKVESQKLSAIELTIIMEDLMQKIENKTGKISHDRN
ncbi:hypothetical protein QTP88_010335 [Uroleucon formosanum]